jgi:DNA/RNA endonuclease G (NUC1)
MNFRRYSVLTLVSLCFLTLVANAAPFTNGNVVIYRVGDGTAALTSNATAVFLDEYTPAGALVQSIALPTAVSGANRRLTASGTSTSEGFVSRSGNDQYLIFAGYDAAVGTASITSSSGSTINRIIARVSAGGTVDTNTALTDFSSGGNPRAAYSLDGLNAWAVGSAGGVRYAALGSTGTSVAVATGTTNLRVVQVFGGQLYVSSQSGTTRLAAVDGGTPTTSGQPITNINGVPSGTLPASPYGYFFADLDAGVAGVDTLYIADDSTAASGGGIQKWCLVGGTWVTRGTVTFASARGLAGSVSGTTVKLFATNGSNVATFTDSTGYNAAVSGTATVVANAPANTAFRGVAFAPVVAGNNPPTINAPANPIATVAQNSAPFNVTLTGNDDGGIYNWSATAGTGVTAVTVSSGQGTASVQYNVTIQAGFTGTATFTAFLSDNVNPAASRPVNISVVVPNNPPAINAPANPIATVTEGAAPFGVSLSGSDDNNVFNWSATAGTGIASVVVSAGQGTANVTYTVTLQAGFDGAATFTARLSDNLNPTVTQAVNITVNPAPPPPLDHLVISQIYGGGGNSSATFTNDYVELFNPTTGPIDTGGWTIQYASATGTAWQAQPLGGIIQPGEYYLVKLATGGAIGAALPVLPNVEGSINMSATTGKVALSSGGDPFDGCPIGDALLVDLVGYGTANCHEGATNAPAPSNTSAIFRKTNGFTDTNVNGSDFVTGTPNPRRTAVISEIGPYVLSVDPRNGSTIAPRDASMGVTFTEAVTVSGAWFNISCTSTGLHNDATVASANGNRLWIITPNVNFLAGETCTATVYKNFVHDDDLDDAGPNTDTLSNDYSWSFTVSTGTLPPYTSDVHLTMGNPSNAVNDPNTSPNNYLMQKPEFAVSYNRDKGTPNWVSWHLTDEWVGSLTRNDTFRPDPQVPPDWYRVLHTDYQNSGFDRGHMTPNADRDKETSIPINQATFLMSNMIPQAPDNNQGPWANLENFLRTLLPSNELYIVAGPAGVGGTGSGGFATTIANGHVTVPAQTWKCALVLPKLSGDDVARVTASTRTVCVIMPNIQGIRTSDGADWMNYLTSVDAVEALTGYDLFANVPDAIENAIEAGVNGVNPPGVDDSSVTTSEDNAVSFTLDVAGTATSYTITGPSHGTLSGSGANRTYTPAPDYFGADSFTFTVSDGTRTSNVGTVSIMVNPVNDAPVAANDSKSTNEDTSLSFAASDLTSNDSTGPANENTQSLTVTTVGGATHGSVSLASGTVTFIPDADYFGAAGFSYTACDDGSPSLCASASVSVSIAPVNDAPVANADNKGTNEDTTLQFPASDLTANDSTGPANESTQSLTVTSVSSASHGSVSLASGTVTFIPDADYFGAASFSYTVCDDGSPSLCATATVHVDVLSVNDAPTAANDSKNGFEDTTLQFPASDLTANDSTGPANESTQSLTVTSVGGATHGSVSLSGGVVSYLADPNYHGSASFGYTVCDDGTPSLCASASVNLSIASVNDAPTASITVPSSTPEGSGVTATVSVQDVDENESFTYAWTVTKNGSPYASGSGASISFAPDDDGSYLVSVDVRDLANASGTDSKNVTATNVAPAITSVSGPTAPLQLGAGASVSATYTDPGTADTHTASITWDDSTSSTVSCSGGTCTAPHTYAAPGVYGVTIVVSDDDGGSDSATFHYVIVVDANGGMVTGGGFIDTPSGKGTFNVDAKYLKNQAAPAGNTQFKVGGSDFKSTSYDWLVVSGTEAQYQGSGTINGSGSYGFLVTVYDGSPDKFRIRVWDKSTLATVYDNVTGAPDDIDTANPQAISSGSIVIH